jgi:hypothetical protein
MPASDDVDPLSIMWLRDVRDQLFHAVPVDQLPPRRDPPGPVALCGQLVLLTSLFDDPHGAVCKPCRRSVSSQ